MMDLFSDQEDEEEGGPVQLTDHELRILPDFKTELRRRGSAEDKLQWTAEHGAKPCESCIFREQECKPVLESVVCQGCAETHTSCSWYADYKCAHVTSKLGISRSTYSRLMEYIQSPSRLASELMSVKSELSSISVRGQEMELGPSLETGSRSLSQLQIQTEKLGNSNERNVKLTQEIIKTREALATREREAAGHVEKILRLQKDLEGERQFLELIKIQVKNTQELANTAVTAKNQTLKEVESERQLREVVQTQLKSAQEQVSTVATARDQAVKEAEKESDEQRRQISSLLVELEDTKKQVEAVMSRATDAETAKEQALEELAKHHSRLEEIERTEQSDRLAIRMQLDFKIRELKKISSRSDHPTYDIAQSLDQVVKSLQVLSDGLLEEACSRDADPMKVVQDMTRRRRRGENGDLEDDSHRKRMKGDDDDLYA